jgi:hypothetical protein
MGSLVAPRELFDDDSTSERAEDEMSLGEFVSDSEPPRLDDFLSGSLTALDIDPVTDVRRVRRRERERGSSSTRTSSSPRWSRRTRDRPPHF